MNTPSKQWNDQVAELAKSYRLGLIDLREYRSRRSEVLKLIDRYFNGAVSPEDTQRKNSANLNRGVIHFESTDKNDNQFEENSDKIEDNNYE